LVSHHSDHHKMFFTFMHVIPHIFVMCHVFILLHFVISMTAAREGYEENELYEDFQDQTFEAEEQQLLNDQG
jgi:hypothetical protein